MQTELLLIINLFAAVGLLAKEAKGCQDDEYLDLVKRYADTVIEKGRDVYGPDKTPLFVDGIRVDTLRAPERIIKYDDPGYADGRACNFAHQQNLLRILVGLSKLTGDEQYRKEAEAATRYIFDNYTDRNGLIYWGGHSSINLYADEVLHERNHIHELKNHSPFYDFLYTVDADRTDNLVKAMWNAHVGNWSHLMFNRHGSYHKNFDTVSTWDHKFEDPGYFPPGGGLPFFSTGFDLAFAASCLGRLSGNEKAREWGWNMFARYEACRHPDTGILPSLNISRGNNDRAKAQLRDLPTVREEMMLHAFPGAWDAYAHMHTHGAPGIFHEADRLRKAGKEEEAERMIVFMADHLDGFARHAYRARENEFRSIASDGTDLTGYVLKKSGYFGKEGTSFPSWEGSARELVAYASGFRASGRESLWNTTRSIAKGMELGDIGASPKKAPALNAQTKVDSPKTIFALIELYRATKEERFLNLADMVARNMLKNRHHKESGLFTRNRDWLLCHFDTYEPLALLQLYAARKGRDNEIPAWDGGPEYIWTQIKVCAGYGSPPGTERYWIKKPEPGTVTWLDQSGLGNDAVASTKAASPEKIENAIGGMSALRFHPGIDLRVAKSENLRLKQMSFFCVWRIDPNPSREALMLIQDPVNESFVLGLYGNDRLFYACGIDGNYTRINSEREEGRGIPELIEASADGRELRLFINGEQHGHANTPGNMNTLLGDIRIGPMSRNGFKGLISEIILFDRGLASVDRLRIGAYLAHKYDLPKGTYEKAAQTDGFKPTQIKGCVLWLDSAFLRAR